MTEFSEDVYRELRTLIQIYAELEPVVPRVNTTDDRWSAKPKESAIWCASCKQAFNETVSQHLARHLGQEWTSTPPPTYG